MRKKQAIAEISFVLFCFLVGIWFRLWLIHGNPQPVLYDQVEYENYAKRMIEAPFMLAPHSYRTYPYPLFIVLVYLQAGIGNIDAVYNAQAVLDSLSGVLVYVLVRYGFGRTKESLLSLVLYTFNPITSGYVGVLLSEVLSTFSIIATLVVGLWFLKKPNIWSGILFGLVAGIAAETRNAAFIWAGIPIALTYFWIRKSLQWMAYGGILLGLAASVLYPLITNYQKYREINITTVDSFYAKEFYNGVMLRQLDPFTTVYPPETATMFYEYYTEQNPERTPAGRKEMADKYFKRAWDLIVKDPWDYAKMRVFKMWYMWQKENIFFYYEPEFVWRRSWIYLGNLLLLGMTIVGLVQTVRRTTHLSRWTWWSTLGSLVYATFVFSFSHAEYRITVPFYPLLFALAGIGVGACWKASTYLFHKRGMQ